MERNSVPLGVKRIFLTLVTTVTIVFLSSLVFMILQGRKGLSDERTVLAVLPIQYDLPQDSPDRYSGFSEGLAAYFGRTDPQILGVLGPASTDRYSTQNLDPVAIGNEVFADLVLAGRERDYQANSVLVMNLLQVSDGSILWSGEFNLDSSRDLRDLLVEVSTEVTSVLNLPR